MKKFIKSTISVLVAAVGFVGGIIWGFKSNWSEMEPIIIVLVTFLEIIGFTLLAGEKPDEPIGVLPISNANSSSNINNLTVNITPEKDITNQDFEDRQKPLTRILFIDDKHTEYKMVSILKKAGWPNTKSIKDVTDLDDAKVLEADIIFVDINGVGITLFEDQGLGLASALKRRYPNKKIVLYSAENTGDRFHRALREVDDCLPKDAEPYQFINLIDSFKQS